MLVPVLCENNALPDEMMELLPQHCPECGYPMEISEALTQLHCSNPRCPSKVTQRLVAIANFLGVKDLGEARARAFVDKFGIDNPLIIFAYESATDGVLGDGIGEEVSARIEAQFQERKRFTLAEFVRMAQLPNIQMSSFAIFDGYDDLEEAYKAIETGGVEFIRDRLNIKEKGSEDISIRAIKVFESLMTFKEDLLQGVGFVDIIPIHIEGMKVIKAVCSTEVGSGFRTKADFYATCNNLYPNIHIEFGSSVTTKTDYLIWAGADKEGVNVTAKVKKARDYNAKGANIKIVSALPFLKILENMSAAMKGVPAYEEV